MNITIPYNFTPRDYQLPIFKAMQEGAKRVYCLWHRRSGKDKSLVNLVAREALTKIGSYYYLFPTYAQAKKVIWDGMDRDGFKFMDHFPEECIKTRHQKDMKLELKNGSVFQLVGTDKYDSIRGTNPLGCVFSEFAFQNPMAWDVIRPILAENNGWAIFNTTPNGKNHAYDLWENVKESEDWYTEMLTVRDTGTISEEFIQKERESGMTEAMIQQEYYCSFDAGALGSYYTDLITQARDENRIGQVPFSIEKETHFWFDLGINDMMSMWAGQYDGEFINLVNYFEDNGKSLDAYYAYIRQYLRDKNGKLGVIYLPHDASQRSLQTGKTTFQCFVEEFGEGHVNMVNIGSVKDGIQQVRMILPKCRFNKDSCMQGIRCLENYKKEYDNEKKVFRNHPLHDWSSHGSDALRYMAMSYEKKETIPSAEEAMSSYVQKLKLIRR